jgi:pentatricopeptide repeat protein
MRGHTIEPDIVTYSILIKCFCKNQLIEIALQLFSTYKLKFKPDEILYDTILDGIVRASNVRK